MLFSEYISSFVGLGSFLEPLGEALCISKARNRSSSLGGHIAALPGWPHCSFGAIAIGCLFPCRTDRVSQQQRTCSITHLNTQGCV